MWTSNWRDAFGTMLLAALLTSLLVGVVGLAIGEPEPWTIVVLYLVILQQTTVRFGS